MNKSLFFNFIIYICSLNYYIIRQEIILSMNKYCHLVYTICTLCICLCCTPGHESDNEHLFEILTIYSYPKEDCLWINEMQKGVTDCLNDAKIQANLHTVYLDLEIVNDSADVVTIDHALGKFINNPPDLIFVCDDRATLALFKANNPLAHTIPVVFSGIDYLDKEMLTKQTHATGFLTTPDFVKTQETANRLLGNRTAQRILIDSSPIGDLARQEIITQVKKDPNLREIYATVKAESEPDSTTNLKEKVIYKQESAGQTNPYNVNIKMLDKEDGSTLMWQIFYGTGQYYITAKWNSFTEIIVEGRTSPYFSVNNEGFGSNRIGGYFTGSYEQTYQAMQTGIQILKGATPSSFPVSMSPKEYIFDWEMLKYWNISMDKLPEESQVINWPLEEKYRTELIILSCFGSLLILSIFFILLRLSIIEFKKKRIFAHMLETDERKLSITIDSLKEAIIAIDKDNKIVRINKATSNILNIADTDNRHIGKPISELCNIITKDNPTYLNTLTEAAQRTGEPQLFNTLTYLVTHDQHTFPISGCVTAMNDQGSGYIISFRNTVSEMTQQKFMELGIAAGNTFLWYFDKSNQFISFDKSFYNSYPLAVRPEEQNLLPVDTFINLIHPDDLRQWTEATSQITGNVKKDDMAELRLLLADGSYIWTAFRIACRPLATSAGPVQQLFGFCTDISNQKNKEQELRVILDKAQEDDRLKTLFLSNMSHEIRTPLNAIVGFSTILADASNYPDEDQERFIQIINQNCQYLMDIINNILEISRIESGFIFQNKPVDLNELIRKLKEEFSATLPDSIGLWATIPGEKIITMGDEYRIRQILTVLLKNAAKFTSNGFIEIGFTYDEKEIHFHIKDSGIGISSEHIDKIFDRFYRIDNFINGSGLGLPICREIVKRMNGSIRVESFLGEGTTFHITIPRIEPEETTSNT